MRGRTFAAFATPSILMMTILMVFPLATAVYLSLHRITLRNLEEIEWVGLQNFREVLADPEFWVAFRWTVLFVAIVVPSMMIVGLSLAMLLDKVRGRMRGVYVAALLLPFVVTPVVGSLIYKDLFERGGLLSWLWRTVTDSALVITAGNVRWLIIFHAVWATTGFAMVVFFAGLQTLPPERVEAASIDGAGFWAQLRFVTLPHLRSLTSFVALITIMDMYRVFDSVFVFAGNRFPAAHTLEVYTYNQALSIQIGRVGKGNALALLTVLGVMVVLIPFLIKSYREQIEDR